MTKQEFEASGKKVLTLQMTREYFKAILKGEQDVEHRVVYPKNASMYLHYENEGKVYKNEGDIPDNESPIEFVTRDYDAIYFINGRKADAPRMLVEVKDAELVFFKMLESGDLVPLEESDDDSEMFMYEENGKWYHALQVWYKLGKVLCTENLNNLK